MKSSNIYLRHETDARSNYARILRDVAAQHVDLAFVKLLLADNARQQRRFAAARCTQQTISRGEAKSNKKTTTMLITHTWALA